MKEYTFSMTFSDIIHHFKTFSDFVILDYIFFLWGLLWIILFVLYIFPIMSFFREALGEQKTSRKKRQMLDQIMTQKEIEEEIEREIKEEEEKKLGI